jgi:hypothetical protein
LREEAEQGWWDGGLVDVLEKLLKASSEWLAAPLAR